MPTDQTAASRRTTRPAPRRAEAGAAGEQAALPCASTPPGGNSQAGRVGMIALAVEPGCNVMVALFARTVATVMLIGLLGDEVRKTFAGPGRAAPRNHERGPRLQNAEERCGQVRRIANKGHL